MTEKCTRKKCFVYNNIVGKYNFLNNPLFEETTQKANEFQQFYDNKLDNFLDSMWSEE